MTKTIILSVASLALIPCTGCGLPLMVVPVPCAGSGARVSFVDPAGKRIHRDGFLIVHRKKTWDRPASKSETSSRLVEVKDGQARLPREWVLGSLWLGKWDDSRYQEDPLRSWLDSGDRFGTLMVGMAMMTHIPPPVLYFSPIESVQFVPLIGGYHGRTSLSMAIPLEPDSRSRLHFRLTVHDNREWPQLAFNAWTAVLSGIRHVDEPYKPGYGLDVRLCCKCECRRVKQYIEQELPGIQAEIAKKESGRLKPRKDDDAQSRPADGGVSVVEE